MNVVDCARLGVDALVSAGFSGEDARRDVAVLIRHLLEWDLAAWVSRRRDEAPATLSARLDPLIRRRMRGEPVAYLLGAKEFWGLSFRVTPDVLVPRPETECLIERVMAALDTRPDGQSPLVVDVGTGSGNIAVTLAVELPDLHLVATDTSAPALDVARANAAHHGVAHRVTFRHGPLTAGADGIDVVVSNPPYVAERDRDSLMRDVRDFEPASALFGGPDGLDVVRHLVADAFDHLKPRGLLAVEIGAGQASAVAELFAATGFVSVQTTNDLAGVPRIVEGRRSGPSV